MRISQWFLLFLSSLLMFSCGGNGELPLDEKGREDFVTFHQKFYQDSAFQMMRIEFPLLGNNPNGSKERFYWDTDNWKIQKAVAPENKDVVLIPFFDMEDVIRERVLIQNRFMIENLFSLINNKWYMTHYSGIHDIGYYSENKKTEEPNEEIEAEEIDSAAIKSE